MIFSKNHLNHIVTTISLAGHFLKFNPTESITMISVKLEFVTIHTGGEGVGLIMVAPL